VALETYFDAKKQGFPIPTMATLLNIFDEVIREEEDCHTINWGRTTREAELQMAEAVLGAYFKELTGNEVLAVEEMFRLDLPGLPPLIGRIDLIERDWVGNIVIVDFKTASAKPSSSTDPYVPGDVDATDQMTIYQLWAKTAFPGQVVKLRLDYLIKSSKNPVAIRYGTVRTEADEQRLTSVLRRTWNQIQMARAGVIEAIPTRSFRCAGCGYRHLCRQAEVSLAA